MLALGTMSVTAGVITVLKLLAGGTTIHLPAQVLGWMFVMHFNWVTHNALAKDGNYYPVNLDSGYYWLGNRIFFGIYMHGNHHKRANVFNPLFWDEAKFGPACPIVKPYPVPRETTSNAE